MSFKEINNLRKEGKKEAALEMAITALESDSLNIWTRRAYAWVIYEYVKANTENLSAFFEWMEKVKELAPAIGNDNYQSEMDFLSQTPSTSLPHSEKMVFDSLAFQVGKVANALSSQSQPDRRSLLRLFELIKNFNFTKPSDGYSFILKSFLKGFKETRFFLEFADWWDLENLRTTDYQTEIYKGKSIMALAEQAYCAYAKSLLLGEEVHTDDFTFHNHINSSRIEEFLPKLEQIIVEFPEYTFPVYYKTKLLHAIGKSQEAAAVFLPFARRKQNDFWVWELLAELQPENETALACLCKALTLKTPKKFLTGVKEKLAALLIKMQYLKEASIEIHETIQIKQENAHHIPHNLTNWSSQEWFQTPTDAQTNHNFYINHKKSAETLIFSDIPQETIAIEFVNTSKKMASFVKNKEKAGFFKYDQHFQKIQIGDIVEVRLELVNENFYRLLTARHVEHEQECEAIEPFDGVLLIKPGNSFGFVDSIFVEPRLIDQNKLINGQQIKGKAILSFNKKKNEWGWKAIAIFND